LSGKHVDRACSIDHKRSLQHFNRVSVRPIWVNYHIIGLDLYYREYAAALPDYANGDTGGISGSVSSAVRRTLSPKGHVKNLDLAC